MTRPILLATGGARRAALAPAAASANDVGGVPAASQSQMALPEPRRRAVPRARPGKVEHRVTIVAVSGTKAVASRERQELWLSAEPLADGRHERRDREAARRDRRPPGRDADLRRRRSIA